MVSVSIAKRKKKENFVRVLLYPVKLNTLNMPANLENSAVATGLEKVSVHSNPKERQ